MSDSNQPMAELSVTGDWHSQGWIVKIPIHIDPARPTPREWEGAYEEHHKQGSDHEGIYIGDNFQFRHS